jgi:ABC-type antimicrobial peptide transport system permease subunit
MYIPWTQREGDQPSAYSYLVRVASGDPRQIAPTLDRVIRDADPALRLRRSRPYASLVGENIGTERTMAVVGGFFGALAIVIAGVGVFGVLAFQVARRTNELGIRMALGASRAGMMALVLRDVTAMVAIGVALGAGGAFVSADLARNLVFGISATEPAVLATAAAVLGAAAFLAAWLPARRAARVDPLTALRHE